MTTLYEHKLLGSKIMMINARFNIPFLVGDGNICLYESGITLLDAEGNEKYIIELKEFDMKYERYINTKNIKYITKVNFFTYDVGLICSKVKHRFKRVNSGIYGKFILTIPEIGTVELFDNYSLKYKKLYDKICDLRSGVSPLNTIYKSKGNLFSRLFKNRLF